MHELTICLHILNIVEKQSKINNFQRVTALWLEIGNLAGIDIDALTFSFPIAASKSIAKEARLNIIEIPGRGFCQHCNMDISVASYFVACPICQRHDYQITAGAEMKIVKMEVE